MWGASPHTPHPTSVGSRVTTPRKLDLGLQIWGVGIWELGFGIRDLGLGVEGISNIKEFISNILIIVWST